MHSTLNCVTRSGIKRNSSVVCFSPAANTSTVGCVVSVRKRTSIRLIELNLLGTTNYTLKCETRCFAVTDQKAICYPPKKSLKSDLKICYNVASCSSLSKISLFIGSTPTTEKPVSYNAITEHNDMGCYVHMSDQVTSDVNCCYLVLQRSQINQYVLDIGYSQAAIVRCVTKGESYSDLKCCIYTHMKTTTVDCFVHRSVEPDNISELMCICYRLAGSIAQVQPFQVIGGFRHINDMKCVMKTPTPSIYNLLCCNHGAIDALPSYTTMRSGNKFFLNIYNIGSREVLGASIKQRGLDLPASNISFNNNLWVITFNLSEIILSADYFIVLQLKGVDKIIILSAVKGKINLG